MKKDLGNLHEGHRKRLRDRYTSSGSDGMSDHNLLELLLFFSVPRVDTNETAHRLLEKFGSLEGVFKADHLSLMSVNGVGENSATQIKLVFDICNRINEQKCSQKRNMLTKENAEDYLVSRMSKYQNEVLMLLMLNNAGELIRSSVISEGSKSFVNIDIRKILEPAYACGASSVIIAHNHPDGMLIPSREDIAVTANIYSSLKTLHLNLSEHYIVNAKGVVGILDYVCKNKGNEIQRLFGND